MGIHCSRIYLLITDAECEGGWRAHSNRCYKRWGVGQHQKLAAARCGQEGGTLAIITDEEMIS